MVGGKKKLTAKYRESKSSTSVRLAKCTGVLLPLVFGMSSNVLANKNQDDLSYQKRVLELVESVRELDQEISGLGTDLNRASGNINPESLTVHLEYPTSGSGEAENYWKGIEVRLNGVRLTEAQKRSSSKVSWTTYVSPGKHDLEIVFTGVDQSGKFVEVTQRRSLKKVAGVSHVHIVSYPYVSRPVIGRSTGKPAAEISVSSDPFLQGGSR